MNDSRPRVWVIEIGEPLPLQGDERLIRYGLVLPELTQAFNITWWTSTFVHQTSSSFSRTDQTLQHRGVEIKALAGPGYSKSTSPRRLWHHWRFARTFAARAAATDHADRPDVILVSNPTSDNLRAARRVAARFNARLVVDIRDNWPGDLVNAAAEIAGHRLARLALTPYFSWTRACLAAADVIVGSSPLQLDYAQELLGSQPLPNGSRTIFHPFPALEQPKNEAASINALEDLGVDFSRSVLVFAGTIGRFFELELAVDAMSTLRDQGLQLVIAGDGIRRESLQAKIDAAGLQADCVLTGWLARPELSLLLRRSAAGLAPYINIATVGNKIGEYFAHGLPVVSSLRTEVVDDSVAAGCAAYYQSGSKQALIDAIRVCLDLSARDDERSVAQRCKALHHEHFSVAAATAAFNEVLWPA